MPVSRTSLPAGFQGGVVLWLVAAGVAAAEPGDPGRLTLEQAYDRTLATDQSIAIALIEIHKANLLPLSALTRLGPQISARLGYDPSETTTTGGSGTASAATTSTGLVGVVPGQGRRVTTHTDLRRASLSWQQTLLDFTVFPAYRLGRLTAQSTRLQYQAAVRDALFGVAKAYYDVLKLQSIVQVNQQTLDLASEQLDQAQKRFDLGVAARTDTLRARATLEESRKTLIESQATLTLARNTLSNILNFGGRAGFELVEPPSAKFDDEPFEAALAQAYARREDYQVSALAIQQDIERRKEIRGEYGPRIVADISQNWDTYNGEDRSVNNWSASIALQIPLFTGGQREIDMRTAQHQIDQTRLDHEITAKSIQSELKAAWLAVRTLRETILALRAQVDAAEQNHRDLTVQYDAGAATSLDVQIALRDLNNARTNLAAQTYDQQVALRDLERAQAAFQPLRVSRAAAMLQSSSSGRAGRSASR